MIAILDYGSGNLRSAQRAFAHTGLDVQVTSDVRTCIESDGLVVPGVGAFQSCMNGLQIAHGDEIIKERISKSRPVLGICVGMQILFARGLEPSRSQSSSAPGLAYWDSPVSKLGAPVLPHMGWNTVQADPNSVLFKGLSDETFYFVHSYAAKDSVGAMQAWTTYGDTFLSAVEDGPLSATQFHPEKSGKAGLAFIRNWLATL
ncbi:unannotated protein [freshwater metagenome]|uniref:Unannotated protein n=1 Tax=freshwater metagenome TaxID=449393 RepID=A0A6J7FM53_9ZZZZ|nr:imidazole glycerol phosphate synthase subunit HisH [Actinomycetota bacterium]MSW23095.1 imidazole glycerol phosphate synthase subunit HisH [Actinomycetota bacterium]MSW75138.1 imidazole glycerol phosphate synthase subunit HisH [Actinomycetota bacterium]MSY30541.1 imidazole glycerol phosphate synthase subunit HisH [Actinomycetota bacterium]